MLFWNPQRFSISPTGKGLIILSALLIQSLQTAQAVQSHLISAQVEKKSVPQVRTFQANIEATNQATVSSQTAGRVTAVNFDVDDTVTQGDIIVQVKDTEQKSNYDAAVAGLKEAQARANEAASEYQRISDVYKRKLISKAAFDKAKADRSATIQRLDAAKAKLKVAKEQLEYTRVRAPYSGIVVERFVEVGESVTVGQPLIKGISLEQLRAVSHIPQSIVNTVREYRQASVVLPSGERAVATDMTISPYAESNSHTFEVRVDLTEGVKGLYPGMFCKVEFLVGENEQLVVPQSAVVHRSEVTAVYILNKDKSLSLRKIVVGSVSDEGQVIVLSGVSEDERVALEPGKAAVMLRQQREQSLAKASESNGDE